jgi:hypothetical protein
MKFPAEPNDMRISRRSMSLRRADMAYRFARDRPCSDLGRRRRMTLTAAAPNGPARPRHSERKPNVTDEISR